MNLNNKIVSVYLLYKYSKYLYNYIMLRHIRCTIYELANIQITLIFFSIL